MKALTIIQDRDGDPLAGDALGPSLLDVHVQVEAAVQVPHPVPVGIVQAHGSGKWSLIHVRCHNAVPKSKRVKWKKIIWGLLVAYSWNCDMGPDELYVSWTRLPSINVHLRQLGEKKTLVTTKILQRALPRWKKQVWSGWMAGQWFQFVRACFKHEVNKKV